MLNTKKNESIINRMEFIVLTCDKYLKTRVNSIRESWGYGESVKYLTDTQSDLDDVISYNTQKNYNGVYDKYFMFFKTYDFLKKDYYFFTDDDTFVNKKNLANMQLPSRDLPFCVGRVLCLKADGTDIWGNQTGTDVSLITGYNVSLPLYYPSGGSGFILSQSACLLIQSYINAHNNIPYCKYGDVSIGFWIRNCGIELHFNKNFWWDTHNNLINNKWELYTTDEHIITFHYVNEDLMKEYHTKYNL
jgi:hypothetical protein